MSVDLSNDTWDSDLSMVIDDFLAKGSRMHEDAVQSFAPVTSTPHIRNNRFEVKDPVQLAATKLSRFSFEL
jgi:hypothetical protein